MVSLIPPYPHYEESTDYGHFKISDEFKNWLDSVRILQTTPNEYEFVITHYIAKWLDEYNLRYAPPLTYHEPEYALRPVRKLCI